ncbi:hypothetical protein BV22DRAFT_886399 [Leucogyrophana mollusca]|uniref:Uncharacterized protein n=1 Tax=Leucogyrophana mollusca TaxID=85980 RepID=A0ACB8B0E4_9AGAM|nr:hypothetical protein BV22DRAFT_886399 [Leucogyrophana mollusca]
MEIARASIGYSKLHGYGGVKMECVAATRRRTSHSPGPDKKTVSPWTKGHFTVLPASPLESSHSDFPSGPTSLNLYKMSGSDTETYFLIASFVQRQQYSGGRHFRLTHSIPTLTGLVKVVAVAILVYDYLLTVHLEYDHVWHSRWTPVKALFFFARYLPFVDTAMAMLFRTGNLDSSACHGFIAAVYGIYAFAFPLTDVVLALRIWAVYGKSRKVAAFLFGLYTVTLVTAVYVSAIFSKSFTLTPNIEGSCVPSQGGSILPSWIEFAIVQGVCLAFMARKAYQVFKQKQGSTDLYRIVVQDGIVYYAIIFGLSLMNVIIITTQPESLDLLTTPVRVIHSVVAGRIILHIRQAGLMSAIKVFTCSRSSRDLRWKETYSRTCIMYRRRLELYRTPNVGQSCLVLCLRCCPVCHIIS